MLSARSGRSRCENDRVRRRLSEQTSLYSALADRQRREIYLHVRRASAALTKDAVAAGVGISRTLATFHLERLLEEGLLLAKFERRAASGAGRPSKHYYASDAAITLTIPDRRYDVAAEILSRAVVDPASGGAAGTRSMELARERGLAVGASFAKDNGIRPSRGASAAQTETLLEEMGYEPRRDGVRIELANCPFHALIEEPFLICGMNKHLLDGALEGCGAKLVATMQHAAGHCCVVVHPKEERRP